MWMKTIIGTLIILFLCTAGSRAAFVQQLNVVCSEHRDYNTIFLVFADNGYLRGMTGADCSGHSWAHQYEVYTGKEPIVAYIERQTETTLIVAAKTAVDIEILGLSTSGGQRIGPLYQIDESVQNETGISESKKAQIDIADLPAGQYAIVVTKDGKTLNLLLFQK